MPVVLETPTADDLARDEAWWTIYDESFPPSEREPREVVLRTVRTGVGRAIRARENDEVVGLATLHLLRNPSAVFLVYLAVERDRQGCGIGRQLFEEAWTIGAAAQRAACGIVWEVDIPSHGNSFAEVLRRERRIRFFERCGGHLLPTQFQQPPVDGIAPVPMHLMYRAKQGGGLPEPDEMHRLVRAVYFEKYGAANGISAETLTKLLITIGAS